jgi:xylulokinase
MITVGLDIGTTSVKALAADDDGKVLARARVPHAVRTPFDGAFEHDVDHAWRANVVEALRQVAQGLDVDAVNVAAMVPSLGAVGEAGDAVGPGLLYGDVRGEVADRDVTQPGNVGEVLAFLAWHAQRTPDARGYWPAQAVANHALTGSGAVGPMVAITAYPLFDFEKWDPDLVATAGTTADRLPAIAASPGRVRDGLPAAGAHVAGGTIDALGEQVVAGADDDGDVLVLCGTTLITWGVLPEQGDAPGLWSIPHTAPGKWLIGGPSNAGGLFLERIRAWAGHGAAAHAHEIGPDSLPVWLPYIRGERTPLHRTDLRSSVHDLGLGHGPEHVLRAAYEAAGFVVRRHLELGAAAGLEPRRIVASGGGTCVEPWVRALADCTGLPVDVVAVPEGGALGAAFDARCQAGSGESLTDARRWARTARTVEPDAAWVDAAARRYERFRALTDAAVAG